jgi:uncharacterized lipoprotein YmbA
MNARRAVACAGMASVLLSCAGHVDHFYTLSTQLGKADAPAAGAPRAFDAQVILSTTVPPVVDRTEMLVHTSDDQVLILEHERWAAPLSELVAHTLARDIEQRRPAVIVGDRGFDQAATSAIKVKVDVVQLSARKAGHAVLEAHWRIVDNNSDQVGGEIFTAPVNGDDYAAIARAYSVCLASLSDRIAEKLPVH